MRILRYPLLALVALCLLAVPVLANHVTPELVGGEESCGPLSPGTVEFVVPVADITDAPLGDDAFQISMQLATDGSNALSFSGATIPVSSAFVRGATSGNLYSYDEAVAEDTGLIAPDGVAITDISVCYVAAGAASPDASPSADGTPPATDTEAVNDSASGSMMLVVGGILATGVGLALFARTRRLAVRRVRW
jgi:hypothetical protein